MQPEEEFKPQESPEEAEPLPAQEPAADEPTPELIANAETGVKTEDTPEPLRAQAPKKSFWSKLLPWVIVALLFYLGGLATIYFALYQPAKDAAAAAASSAELKITSLDNQISQLEMQKSLLQSELDTTRNNLVDTQNDLAEARATIEEQLTDVANANVKRLAYKLLGNINSARAALERLDTSSARQALNFAKDDLGALQGTDLPADALSGVAERLEEALANLTAPGLEKSRAALDILYTNLLLLVDNLP